MLIVIYSLVVLKVVTWTAISRTAVSITNYVFQSTMPLLGYFESGLLSTGFPPVHIKYLTSIQPVCNQ